MEVWNGFFLDKADNEDIICRFRDALDKEGHLFFGMPVASL